VAQVIAPRGSALPTECAAFSRHLVFSVLFRLLVGLVAQSVEQRIENPCVGGSIPPQATIQFRLTTLGRAFLFVKRQLARGSDKTACAGRSRVCRESSWVRPYSALCSLENIANRFPTAHANRFVWQ
jgi:hypothetical protein